MAKKNKIKKINILKILACGVTSNNQPNVVVQDEDEISFSLWYHSTFYNINDALDFLKDIYRDGIPTNDFEDGLWLTMKQLQEER